MFLGIYEIINKLTQELPLIKKTVDLKNNIFFINKISKKYLTKTAQKQVFEL